jgi:hypothetical protein
MKPSRRAALPVIVSSIFFNALSIAHGSKFL